jgi:hypothetical protein
MNVSDGRVMASTEKKVGMLSRARLITRDVVRANPGKFFVFGDNMERRGYGGQAAAMRGELNSIGVPTKWLPARTEKSYFSDKDADNPEVRSAIVGALNKIEACLQAGHDVVIPEDGLGTGLAELPTRAPRIHRYIQARISRMFARQDEVATNKIEGGSVSAP